MLSAFVWGNFKASQSSPYKLLLLSAWCNHHKDKWNSWRSQTSQTEAAKYLLKCAQNKTLGTSELYLGRAQYGRVTTLALDLLWE